MDKVVAFSAAFFHYFITEEVSYDMAESVAEETRVSVSEARSFCERNKDLLVEAHAQVEGLIELIGQKAKTE